MASLLDTPEPVPLFPVRVVVNTLLFWYVHWLASGGHWPGVIQAGAFFFLSVTTSLLLHCIALAACRWRATRLTPEPESVTPTAAAPARGYRAMAASDGTMADIKLGKLRFSVRGGTGAKISASGNRTTIDTGCAVVEVEELP